MAKGKKTTSKADKVPDVESIEPKASEQPEAGPAPLTGYLAQYFTSGEWKGHKQYCCRFCPSRITGSAQDALNHLTSRHFPKREKPQTVDTGLVNSGGDPITRTAEAEEGDQ